MRPAAQPDLYGVLTPIAFSAASMRSGGFIGMVIAPPVSQQGLQAGEDRGPALTVPESKSSLIGRSCECNIVSFTLSPAGTCS